MKGLKMSRVLLAFLLLLPSFALAQPSPFKLTGAAPAPITPARATDYLKMPSGDIRISGSSTGVTSLASANASATNYTITLPAANGTLLYSSGPGGTPSSLTLTNATGLPVSGISGSTTVGGNLIGLANPSAITFIRLNADNSVTARSAANFRSDIGAGTGAGDALVADPLSQFAATTSAQLAATISDEVSGTGAKLLFGNQAVSSDSSPTFGTVTAALTGNATTATTLATARNLWGQSFDGSADITGNLVSVSNITGGASSMTITAGTGASRSLTLRSTSAGSVSQAALILQPNLTANFFGEVSTPGTITAATFVGALTGSASGSAASLSVSGQTGVMTVTGLTATNRAKTVRDAADTILELGGSYTPTGMFTNMILVTPALGTPSALVGTNITGTATGFTSGLTNALKSATTTVNVSSATAPTTGQVLTATGASAATWQTPTGGTATAVTVANEATDTTSFLLFATAATGDLGPKSNSNLAFNASTGGLTLAAIAAASLATPTITTASGDLTVTPAAGSDAVFAFTAPAEFRMTNATSAGFSVRNTTATFDSCVQVGTAGNINLYSNWNAGDNAQSDATKISWGARLNVSNDRYEVYRAPAGGALVFKGGIDASANVLIGGTTVGTGLTNGISFAAGSTTPVIGAAAADVVQIASVDFAAAKRRLYVQAEDGTATIIGGNEFYGGTASGGNLLLSTTSHATKGTLTIDSSISANGKATLDTNGVFTKYNNIATVSGGVPAIRGTGRSTGQTAAVASVATYTVGSSDASFIVDSNVLITSSNMYSFTVTCAYTDEGNTARTQTFMFSNLAGTTATTITIAGGAVPYASLPLHIRCKASTAITIATTGSFSSVTYNVEGRITEQ